jgi:hypothetical protein
MNFYKALPKLSLSSETVKREFLIAPILREKEKFLNIETTLSRNVVISFDNSYLFLYLESSGKSF